MNWWKNQKRLISWTGIFISGILIAIYLKGLLNPETTWSAFKKMQITMYWFSVAFFFRLGTVQITYIFIYSLVKGLSIFGLGLLWNKFTGSSQTYITILAIWVYFNTLTSSMVKKPYADYTFYKLSKYIYVIFSAPKQLQKNYNQIMDKIALESTKEWTYYDWIYFRHKEIKKVSPNGEKLCTISRPQPHEGWVVFYFEYILSDEVYENNITQVSIMQPYTSLLGMEGTQRVTLAIEKYLARFGKEDKLNSLLKYILEEMSHETKVFDK